MSAPLLGRPVAVASAGIENLAEAVEAQPVAVERVDWSPPLAGAREPLECLIERTATIAAANDVALARMQAARPLLTGVARARDVLPGMEARTILHAGPPVDWADAAGPLRGAVIGALLYEGLAADPAEAERMAAARQIELSPCHEHDAVGPMAGVVSASMPVWVVEEDSRGGRAHCTFNEGLGRVLRYGAHDASVLERLRWMQEVLGPVMSAALRTRAEPLDLRMLLAEALQMGDEGHNRHRAATALFLKQMLAPLLELEAPSVDLAAAVRFIAANDHFFLNLAMPAAKAIADTAAGIEHSTIVTAMARNGTEFGIRVSATAGRWFVGPAQRVEGLYFPGYGPDDAALDIGDSAITETVGLGGFAMAAAPAIVNFVGGAPGDALAATLRMYDIAWAESETWLIPALGFRGGPFGIDCRAVCRNGVLPIINSGIAHRAAGVGQIGAGHRAATGGALRARAARSGGAVTPALERLRAAGLAPVPLPAAPPQADRASILARGVGVLAAQPELPAARSLAAGLRALCAALAGADARLALRAGFLLTGLGPGLTPLGDDVLTGATAAAAALGPAAGLGAAEARRLTAHLTHAAQRGRTTSLSAELLLHAARGWAMPPLRGLLDLTPAGREGWREHLVRLQRVGASSGRGCALGAGIACVALGVGRGNGAARVPAGKAGKPARTVGIFPMT